MNTIYNNIDPVDIEKELTSSYLDYAMSVIVGRALPDVRDGLKPVHRRILFAMKILGNDWNKPYKKSARVVGDVIGKYHPHGDSAVYESIVRMAQPFSLRYTLIEGQGNFGSIDGDTAAAMRYTEIRMSKIAHTLLEDLEKDTVEFLPNYDETEKIPEILPTRIPNLLINGSSGIAVGMATNIPPHNLNEVINACLAYINNHNISLKELMHYIPGPDFPTYGIISGYQGIENAYRTGKGKIYIRARHKIEKNIRNKRESIIIYELPYQVNKAILITKIAELMKEKKIEGIHALRDESDKDGMRIVLEIKKDTIKEILLNQLYMLTQMQISFGINMVALYYGQPKIMSLKNILKCFLSHRKNIITRRTIFELKKAKKKIQILKGLTIALNNINEIIEIIQQSKKPNLAKEKLLSKKWTINTKLSEIINVESNILQNNQNKTDTEYKFTTNQVEAILELKLQRLTTLEQERILDEYNTLLKKIKSLSCILNNNEDMLKIIKKELKIIQHQFGDKRKTEIIEHNTEVEIEDMIPKEDVVVTLSHKGYVKYQPLSDYNTQHRGGKGKSAAKTTKEDYIETLLITNTHDTILCFSNRGILYKIKVYQLPEASRHAIGRPIINLIPLGKKERITAILNLSKATNNKNVFMLTASGIVKKTPLHIFKKPRSTGMIAIHLKNKDELIGAEITNGINNIMLFSKKGKVVHFSEKEVRKMGRTAYGIRGINIDKDDQVVSLLVPHEKGTILTMTENGYGKRTKIENFPIKSRATKGVRSIKITKKNGVVISAIQVSKNDQIMMITNAGTLVRTNVSEIRILGRNTQGVILIRTSKKEKVVALQKIANNKLKCLT
ncbi:DNA topoisomerase (ATP-hydrolyzing) subunit A [Buchnera aphidicola]|uniref:DNA gyrase subunit A n=1 Tax=Buchnera aphidicola (Sarucallis kahawaluokalani) TaxID=1241878 RepID=A0A4D6YHV7_9GAMM|nr:DNA topoisomerase (ATP-hydrolyzing) subunit A [Buchnera aphidicola]QCI25931.1 DNA topoisomerase (ATP-hydrolyzing) subunit A [Buchnera aphidicola (Sarucallis kahawaluokalani)]